MAKLILKRGTTSKIVRVFIQDSSQTNGDGLTGLAYNTASLTAYYIREGDATATAITLVTATVGTYTSGGFVAVDGTNLPGVYEIGLPNAALASGDSVIVMLKGATNMVPTILEIELDAYDPQDTTALGLSNLDTTVSSRLATSGYTTPDNTDIAAIKTTVDTNLDTNVGSRLAAAAYSVPPSAATISSTVWSQSLPGAFTSGQAGNILGNVVPSVWANATRTLTSLAGNASDIANAVWNELTSGHTTSGSFGSTVGTNIDAAVSSRLPTNSYTAPLSSSQTASAVWDEPTASHTTLGSFGATIGNLVSSIWSAATRTLSSLASNAADIASGVWNATASSYDTAGSTGNKLSSAASAGDPWTTAIPGSYAAGTAGYIVGTNLDDPVSSRAAPGDNMTLDLTQAIPTSNTAQTVGDALNAARAEGFGKWVLIGTTLTLYAGDGVTVVRTFTLDSATNPTQRS